MGVYIDEDDSSGTYLDGLTTTDWITYIVNVYIDGTLSVFGLIGNTLALVIFHLENSRTSNTFFLQTIAVLDNFLLLANLLYITLRSVYPPTGYLQVFIRYSPYIIAYVVPIGWISQTGICWLTLAAAGDRYLAISKPFKATQICTLKNARKVGLTLSVSAILFNIPRFFHYQLAALNSQNNETFLSHARFNLTEWNSDVYHYLYHISLTFLFIFIIPITAMIFFNHKLVCALREANHSRQVMVSNQRHSGELQRINVQVTRNLVVIITVFMSCQAPDFLSAIFGAIGMPNKIYHLHVVFSQMMLVFNSSINFYIYMVFNQRFRRAAANLCCCTQLGDKSCVNPISFPVMTISNLTLMRRESEDSLSLTHHSLVTLTSYGGIEENQHGDNPQPF